ncbi:MAG: hypothetical protein U9Q99_02590 [Nanoarchaeota archaeon]|nr:hypothetical protein [Nanoarchaeota archaeon]
MIEDYNLERKGYFLLSFTEAMIKNSKVAEFYRLKEILKLKNVIVENEEFSPKSVEEQVKEKLQKDKTIVKMSKSILSPPEEDFFQLKRAEESLRVPIKRKSLMRRPVRAPLRPVENNNNIKPIATAESIELGKINPLISDPNVVTMEISEQNKKIIVTGKMGRQSTGIVLNKEEINEIIDKFSKAAKIPVQEGPLKIIYGNLILDANISPKKGSSFLIRKIR